MAIIRTPASPEPKKRGRKPKAKTAETAESASGVQTVKTIGDIPENQLTPVADARVERLEALLKDYEESKEKVRRALDAMLDDMGRLEDSQKESAEAIRKEMEDRFDTCVKALDSRLDGYLDGRLAPRIAESGKLADKRLDEHEDLVYRALRKIDALEGFRTAAENDFSLTSSRTDSLYIRCDDLNKRVGRLESLFSKVDKLERESQEAFDETGRMIRTMGEEAKKEAQAMETRLREESREQAEARAREAVRVTNKDVTEMKLKMAGVFDRMKNPAQERRLLGMQSDIDFLKREKKSTLAAMMGAVVLGVLDTVVLLVMLLG